MSETEQVTLLQVYRFKKLTILICYVKTGLVYQNRILQRTVPFRHCPDYLKYKIQEVFLTN